MKLPSLIAIAGFKNAGKDTAADMLQYLFSSPKFLHSYKWYKLLGKFFRNKKFKLTSFAYPLKRTLAALLDIDIAKFEDRDFKENYYIYFPTLEITNKPDKDKVISDGKFSRAIGNKDLSFIKTHYITIRQLLQVFGTECMRSTFGDNIWILSTLKDSSNKIISDLRFKVEWEAIQKLGGITIYIHRNIAKPGNHASEKELEDLYINQQFSYVIDNNDSLESLFNNLKIFCQYIL